MSPAKINMFCRKSYSGERTLGSNSQVEYRVTYLRVLQNIQLNCGLKRWRLAFVPPFVSFSPAFTFTPLTDPALGFSSCTSGVELSPADISPSLRRYPLPDRLRLSQTVKATSRSSEIYIRRFHAGGRMEPVFFYCDGRNGLPRLRSWWGRNGYKTLWPSARRD